METKPKYTQHGRYNMETKKPYVEIKKDGKHYAYMPWSIHKIGREDGK
tara:strand:- start:1139 stop:1282 length:144 start_codon:yes stop_codon:yes gene_type:complete